MLWFLSSGGWVLFLLNLYLMRTFSDTQASSACMISNDIMGMTNIQVAKLKKMLEIKKNGTPSSSS